MITPDIHRVLPLKARFWTEMCNHDGCTKTQLPESGYCAWHSSKAYVTAARIRRKVLMTLLYVVVAPPVLLIVGGLLWKLALFVVFNL